MVHHKPIACLRREVVTTVSIAKLVRNSLSTTMDHGCQDVVKTFAETVVLYKWAWVRNMKLIIAYIRFTTILSIFMGGSVRS